MFYLKCTLEVQKAIGLRKENLAASTETEALLGNWYVNRFDIGHRKAFIFMSQSTLLSFVLFQGEIPTTQERLPTMLLAGLQQLLEMRGISNEAILRAFRHCETAAFAKTDSRADLGSLNDLVHHYQCRIEYEGGLGLCDLTRIIMSINEMPQRRLGWGTSWDAVQSKLSILS
jgi:hypothetical protein